MLRFINLPAVLLTVCLIVLVPLLSFLSGGKFYGLPNPIKSGWPFYIILMILGAVYTTSFYTLARRFNPAAVLLSSNLTFAVIMLLVTIVSFGLLIPSNAIIHMPCRFEYNPAGGAQVVMLAFLITVIFFPIAVGLSLFLNWVTGLIAQGTVNKPIAGYVYAGITGLFYGIVIVLIGLIVAPIRWACFDFEKMTIAEYYQIVGIGSAVFLVCVLAFVASLWIQKRLETP